MTYNEALAEIVTWITDNNNKEITAAIMRDVLTTLLDYSAENIGDTDNLFAETNTVDAINALKSLIDGIDLTLGLTVHNGINNPNIVPPSSYAAPDIYVREDDALKEVYIFNGKSWIQIINFSFPIYEAGIFKGNATSLDFSGGNFNLTYDAITGVMTVEVTGEGVEKLEDVGDVPAYPNDGQEWVLVELDGALTWQLKGSGTGGQVDSVVGTAGQIDVDDTDPENPVLSLSTAVTDAISDIQEDYVKSTADFDTAGRVVIVDSAGRVVAQGSKLLADLRTEAEIINTLRSFSKPQWLDVAVLTAVSNIFTPDLGVSGSFTADIGANSTLANPTIPSGYDTGKVLAWDITFTITGAGGWTLGFGNLYRVDAGVDIALIISENNTTGDIIKLMCQYEDGIISVQPFIPTAIP